MKLLFINSRRQSVAYMTLVVGSICFLLLHQATLFIWTNLTELTLSATANTGTTPTTSSPKFDLTVSYMGRFGNHMFMVASAYGIALRNQRRFTLLADDPSSVQLQSIFDGVRQLPTVHNTTSFSHAGFPRWGVFNSSAFNLPLNGSMMVDGYLQSYKYFHDQQHRIRDLFRFNGATMTTARRFITKVTPNSNSNNNSNNNNNNSNRNSNNTIVGIHVRRGDYTGASQRGYLTPDVEYYHRAMEYFRKKLVHVLFIVMSDDLQWCNNNLQATDVVFGSTGSPPGDLCVLSILDHIIISAGTFSWWASYLNRGETVCYQNIILNGSDLATDFNQDDYFPHEWTPL